MSDAVIRTKGLTKYYGKVVGVDNLDLEVEEGEIYGFLGPNGAGKTTTIRVLLDFIHPSKGRADIFGLDTRKDSVKIKRRVGYLPGELELYKNMKGSEFLRHFSYLRGGVDWGYVQDLAGRLDYDMAKPVKSLSSGNKHKLGLIQAFMHKPDLLILDEPTTGLDPLMQQEFNQMLVEAQEAGQTTFISSHILPEVERICDRVGFIRRGRLIDVREISDLKERALRQIEIIFADSVKKEEFSALPGIKNVGVKGNVLTCTVAGPLDSVIKTAAKFEVVDVISREPNLEDLFLTYYGGEQDAAS
jgi:ABC-2 type transport system ATP-binding protein